MKFTRSVQRENIVKGENGSEYIQGECIVKFQYEGPYALDSDAASIPLQGNAFVHAFDEHWTDHSAGQLDLGRWPSGKMEAIYIH